MDAHFAVPKWFLAVAVTMFFVATSTVLFNQSSPTPSHLIKRRYAFVADVAPPPSVTLGPNRFTYSMNLDNSQWGPDAKAIEDGIENATKIPTKQLDPKDIPVAALDPPAWADKLHPLHEDVLKLHQFRDELDPPKHGRKFLIIFPFRDYKIGTHTRNPKTGAETIVTHAERTAQLGHIMPFLSNHLHNAEKELGRDYNFLVMEQANFDVVFSKANVLNAGARLAREWGYDYMVMHDVDFLPKHPQNAYDLPEDGLPVHYVSSLPWGPKYMQYGNHFGGAYGISVKTFFDVNGYSSGFWGWGAEDNMMMLQCFRAGGFHRLNATFGSYVPIEHNSDFKRMTGLLFANNLRRLVAFYLNRREVRKVPLEGVNELNATITRYAPMPDLGGVHWATVQFDTLRYRPDRDGFESKELQRKRATGELPPLSDVGIGPDGMLMTDPPLAPHEIALVDKLRLSENHSFASNLVTTFTPVIRTCSLVP